MNKNHRLEYYLLGRNAVTRSPKRRSISTALHGNISPITVLFVVTVRTSSNPWQKSSHSIEINLQEQSFCVTVRLLQLTNFFELNSSWEADRCAASEEFTNILWNPKVHYRVYKLCYCCSKISEMCHIFERLVSYAYIMILSRILLTRQ
jgi:hypothetical protein